MGDFPVQDGQLWLFQGDSITDAGRRVGPPLGDGYASLFAEILTTAFPERDIRFINKGIGGDTTVGLRNRWEDDVIRHQPDWLSILIGINDLHTWLGDPANGVSPAIYREKYDSILASTKEKTSARLLLIDPFYISIETCPHSFRRTVMDTIPQYLAVVEEMAAKYDAMHLKTHELFQHHLKYRDADVFCPEPVHPNRAGHLVIARTMVVMLLGM